MKKIMNSPETMVAEMCHGMILAHPELEFDPKYKIISRKNQNQNKVSLISGGGSGHEPAHAGYVGKGMLDAAVCGDIFASPSQVQVYQAIKNNSGKKGTLLIVKNYSGDMMNFKNAAYLAKEDGIQVEYVRVDDDIAVQDSLYTVGRRGVAGTIFVHKIAGAAAEYGYDLKQVKQIAEKAIKNTRSIGFALSSCTVPAKGSPTFHLGENEIEYGVGIHGEPGIHREKLINAEELANRMVSAILKDLLDVEGDELAVLINGFGSTPVHELYLLNNSVLRILKHKNFKISRCFVGNYMTSIDMAGASISIIKLDEELKMFLEQPCETPALCVQEQRDTINFMDDLSSSSDTLEANFKVETPDSFKEIINNSLSLNNIIYIVDRMSECIITNEIPFCELDSHAGDGDFGMSIAKGFKQLKREWKGILENDTQDIGRFLESCALVIMEHCGGASGPIWGSAFRAAGRKAYGKSNLSATEIAEMLQAAVKGIQVTGERSFGRGAVLGDKTLIDALIPCANTWSSMASENADLIDIMKKAAKAALDGAKETKKIVARMGRAGTVGERSIGYPDAGAYGLGIIFDDIASLF